MKKNILSFMLIACLASLATPTHAIKRQQLIQYASQLKGLKKAELKNKIYEISQPKTVLGYGSGEGKTWSGFYKTDRYPNSNECVNRYSEKRFYFTNSNTSSAIGGMNIEHSFPKSWWGGTTNNAYKDLFNLYPSDSDANSKKSNYPLGNVTEYSGNDYEKVGKGPAGDNGNIRLCEPNDTWKGDFSRSFFYMATIYQNLTWAGTEGLQILENNKWPTLQKWAYTTYLNWVRADKVLDIEVNRNNAIYQLQGNRNLFIDFPYLAEYVWGDSINVAFDPYTSMTTAEDDDRYETITPGESGGGDNPDINPGGDGDGEDIDNPGGSEDDYVISDEEDYIFCETFNKQQGTGGTDEQGWNGSIASTVAKATDCDVDGWTFGNAVYAANQSLRVGSSKNVGSITTPKIKGLKGKTAILYFKAAAWDATNEQDNLKVSAEGCDLSVSSVTLVRGEWNTYSITLTNITGPVSITFSGNGGNNRFFIDDVCVPFETIFNEKGNIICYDFNDDYHVNVCDTVKFVNLKLKRAVTNNKDISLDVNNDGFVTAADAEYLTNVILCKR